MASSAVRCVAGAHLTGGPLIRHCIPKPSTASSSMKRKVAFVCAYPAGLNPGMLSVDLASYALLGGPSAQLDMQHFCLEDAVDVVGTNRSLHYRHLTAVEQLQDFDAIVFWGDFLHWIGYGTQDYLLRQAKRMPHLHKADILDSWYRLMLLEGRPDLQRKSIVFGSTIYGLDARQITDSRYLSALQSLYGNARLVQLRDVFSASYAQQLGELCYDAFGCDCALLLDAASWAPAALVDRPYAVCSFARSGNSTALRAFAGVVAKTAGVQLVQAQWLDMSGIDGLERKLALIRGAKFVFTDTYHMAVSTLREKIPVLCAGWGAKGIQGSLSDKKKETFFQQAFLRKNYLFVEQISDAMKSDAQVASLARSALEAVEDTQAHGQACALLERQALRATQRCRAALELTST